MGILEQQPGGQVLLANHLKPKVGAFFASFLRGPYLFVLSTTTTADHDGLRLGGRP
jgi:hypothetical protein